jgi:hypothetical protein
MMKTRKLWSGVAGLLMTTALSAALPGAARAQTAPDATSKLLIAILVKKGVLSRADADAILQQATQEAAMAATNAATAAPPPAAPEVNATSSVTPDGTIHVTYVPKIVREQIAQEVTSQVLAQEQTNGYAVPNEVPRWLSRLQFYGDFRFRYEDDLFPRGNDTTGAFPNFNAINTGSPYDISAGNQNFPSQINNNENRSRFRIRARLGVKADLGDGFEADFRLATGENDSPVSENQTLGGANGGIQGGDFSKYALWVDRASLTYNPPLSDPSATLKFSVGRFDNPFFSTNLIFADDLGFDGIMGSGAYDFGAFAPFLTAGAFPIYNTDFSFASNQPQKFPSHDKWLFAAQTGLAAIIQPQLLAKIGLAFYDFANIAGKLSAPCTVLTTADQCSTDDDRPSFAQNGNTYMALRNIIPTTANNDGTTSQYQYFGLASNFDELAITGHVDANYFDAAHLWFDGEYVDNLGFSKTDIANKAVNNRGPTSAGNALGSFAGGNIGYYFNASVGHQKLLQRWDWQASLGYKYLQTDSTVDGLNDSDFGLGGTNLQGYIAAASVALSPRVYVRIRYLSADAIVGPTYRADVFQVDLNGKF